VLWDDLTLWEAIEMATELHHASIHAHLSLSGLAAAATDCHP
jgi:hypothetical protein